MTRDEQAVLDALVALEHQERALADELQKVQVKLARVRSAKTSLSALVNDEPAEFEGKLADAIRTVLMRKLVSYVPTHLRDLVKELGYVFPEGSNQMAAVHGVLKRMFEAGTVKTKAWSKQPGVTRYYWAAFEPELVKAVPKPPNPAQAGGLSPSAEAFAAMFGKKGNTK